MYGALKQVKNILDTINSMNATEKVSGHYPQEKNTKGSIRMVNVMVTEYLNILLAKSTQVTIKMVNVMDKAFGYHQMVNNLKENIIKVKDMALVSQTIMINPQNRTNGVMVR